ncbi:MAG TPA: alpha-galactosidase [Candidatus Koribacter sp.]
MCVANLRGSPQLAALRTTNGSLWKNVESEALVPDVFVADVSRHLSWKFTPAESTRTSGTIRYVYLSEDPKLRLTWEWELRAASGPVEHRIRIENLDTRPVTLPRQESLALLLRPPTRQASLQQLYVEKGADSPSPEGTHFVKLTSRYRWSGYSSTYAHPIPDLPREIIPWTLIEDDRTHSGIYMGAEFSGRMKFNVEMRGSRVQASIGLNPTPGPFRFTLAPGKTFESPTAFIAAFDGDAETAGNTLRRWVREVLGSRETWADERYPYTTNNSWGSGVDINENVADRMIRDSKELGLEMFHLDAGWFRSIGDWVPDPKKFPRGLSAVADEAHRAGLKFGLWMDWAQAGNSDAPGALNVRDPKVYDWLVTDLPKNWKPEAYKGQTIDIGAPEAAHWVSDKLDEVVSDFHLDMLEHDGYVVAEGCVRNDHPHHPPDRYNLVIQWDSGSLFAFSTNSTEVSYRATRAYYALYEHLRQTHPNLLLEICNDGGRMVDFGSAAHGDYFSITDTYDPLSNRRAFYDASWVLPPAMLECYIEKWPVHSLDNFRYMLRSGMMGWLTVMQDTSAWSAEEHKAARMEIELYKIRIRPLIRNADLYHVADRPDGIRWDGIQYVRPDESRGVVFAFRGSGQDDEHLFRLRGLTASAIYRVHFQDGSSPDIESTGRDLMTSGLRVHLIQPQSSELIFFEKQQIVH